MPLMPLFLLSTIACKGNDRELRAFDDLFEIEDRNHDGLITLTTDSGSETGLLKPDLYQAIDAISLQTNGFNQADLRKFLDENGIAGLSRFYPGYEFSCYSEFWRDRIKIQFRFPSFQVELNRDDPNLKQILARHSLFKEPHTDVHYLHANFVPDKPLVVVVEDFHHYSKPRLLSSLIVESFVEKNRPVVFFVEYVGGDPIYDSERVRRAWPGLKEEMLAMKNVTEKELNRKLHQLLRTDTWKGKQVAFYQDAAWKLSRMLSEEELEKMSYEQWEKAVRERKELFKALVSFSDLASALKWRYGSKVNVLNAETPGLAFALQDAGILPPGISPFGGIGRSTRTKQKPEERLPADIPQEQFENLSPDQKMLSPEGLLFWDDLIETTNMRTETWADNIRIVLENPDSFDPQKGEPVIVLLGGGAHLPFLAELLDQGKNVSTLFISPFSREEYAELLVNRSEDLY